MSNGSPAEQSKRSAGLGVRDGPTGNGCDEPAWVAFDHWDKLFTFRVFQHASANPLPAITLRSCRYGVQWVGKIAARAALVACSCGLFELATTGRERLCQLAI
jgi:hypothetical protein